MIIKRQMIITAIMALSLMLISCSKNNKTEITGERVIAVKATVVQTGNEDIIKTYTGSLEGLEQAVLYSKISEAVEKINVKEGDRVTANSVIVSLDQSGTNSSYEQTKAVYKNAEKNYNKMKYLYEEGAVSESMYDKARTDYEVSKAAFDAAQNMIDIKTPISGTVTSIKVSKGDYLSPGQVVATVATTDSLRVKFGVNASDIAHVSVGDPVHITVDDLGRVVTGKVVSVAGSADPSTRAFQVEVVLDNSQRIFAPGMFVRVDIILKRLTDVLAIPRKAILILEGKDEVYVVQGSVAQKREVNIGDDLGKRVVITSGLNAGDTLVTMGQNYLEDGVKVNITSFEDGK